MFGLSLPPVVCIIDIVMIVDRHYLNFVLVTLADFGYLVNRSFGFIAPKILNVYAFENIGVVQHKALHHLSLQNGYHYYATLKGNTFVCTKTNKTTRTTQKTYKINRSRSGRMSRSSYN
jgi:hypothetical protein